MKLSTNQTLNENARKIIRHATVECGRAKFCNGAGISEPTYYNHVKKPECITLRELRVMYRLGKLTDEQILSMIREVRHDGNT